MIIFSPGPANISAGVRRSLLNPDICHRGEEFSALLGQTRKLLLDICGVDKAYQAAVFTGSGTAAIEAVLASLKGSGKKILVLSNGIYGQRAYKIVALHGLKVKQVMFDGFSLPDLKEFEKQIRRYSPRVIYCVHHETTTGLLNPLEKIAKLAAKHGCLLIVDAISSIAGEKILVKKWKIDALIGSANKCIRGISGLSFAIVSPRFVHCLKNSPKNPFYLNLLEHILMEKNGQTPFTPAVHGFYALRQALVELKREGVVRRIGHYKNISSLLRRGLRKIGLRIYVAENISSNTMTTVMLPKNISYQQLYKQCKKHGFCIYSAVGNLKDKAFRLGNVGCISPKDIRDFLRVLGRVVKGGAN